MVDAVASNDTVFAKPSPVLETVNAVDDISVPPDDVPIFSVTELPDELGSNTRKLTRYGLPDTVLIDCVASALFNLNLPLPAEL